VAGETLLEDSAFCHRRGPRHVAVTLQIWPDMIHAFPMWNARIWSRAGARSRKPANSFAGSCSAKRLRSRHQRRPARGFCLFAQFLLEVQPLTVLGGALQSGNTWPEKAMIC
jgi:hypothetical protein